MKVKINFLKPKPINWQIEVNRNIFRVFSIAFLVLFLVEYLQPGFVTNWFNPIWLLIIAIISSIIIISDNKN